TTYTGILPTDGGSRSVLDMGPTFWFGTTVKDTYSFLKQAELEVQFYPDQTTSKCGRDGSYNPSLTVGKWTSCMPVWAIDPNNFQEYAAFNHLLNLSTGTASTPLVMRSGDTVSVRIYVSHSHYNVLVKDLTS